MAGDQAGCEFGCDNTPASADKDHGGKGATEANLIDILDIFRITQNRASFQVEFDSRKREKTKFQEAEIS